MSAATQMAQGLIEIKPEVRMGKPVIAGTRITVEVILEKVAAEQLLDAGAAGVIGLKEGDEPGARVFVEEELHPADEPARYSRMS